MNKGRILILLLKIGFVSLVIGLTLRNTNFYLTVQYPVISVILTSSFLVGVCQFIIFSWNRWFKPRYYGTSWLKEQKMKEAFLEEMKKLEKQK